MRRVSESVLVLCGLVWGLAGCAAMGGGVQDEASLRKHLRANEIGDHPLVILAPSVAGKFKSLPFVVVADAAHRFVWKHVGYSAEIGRELEQGVWVYRPARASQLPLWPLKTPDGRKVGWGDLPRAEFIVFVFFNLRCSMCPGMIADLQAYIQERKPGAYALVLVGCDRFRFTREAGATGSSPPS